MPTPTGLITDESPAWTIIDAARPITDLPLIGSESDWRPGVQAWWRSSRANRLPVQALAGAFDDPVADAIADPAIWPAEVRYEVTADPADLLVSFPNGVKEAAEDPTQRRFRPFVVYTPSIHLELYAGEGPDTGQPTADQQARRNLAAHVHSAVMAEFADGLSTKNPSLYLSASGANDLSGAIAVDPAVAIATLYEGFGSLPAGANALVGGGQSGRAALTVPFHAVPLLIRRRLVTWEGGRLVDCYGNPVITAPGYVGRGPVTDPLDLETSQDPGPGEGWLYISHVPYVGVGRFEQRVEGPQGRGPMGADPWSNSNEALAEAAAIVVFQPDHTYAVNTKLTEVN